MLFDILCILHLNQEVALENLVDMQSIIHLSTI